MTNPIITESDLEKRIELLPKITFDDNEEFQRIVMSPEFSDIFNYFKTNDLIPDKVKILPETTQKISAYLGLTGQDQTFLNQTEDLLYCRKVPTIEEFLRGQRFLGPTNNNLYPYWEKRLQEIFAPQSITKRVLWGGATGTGKTTIAREAMFYSLYKLFCLRNPRSVLNVSNSTTLAVFILSVTQKTAEQTNFNPILDIIKNMMVFQQVRSTNSFVNFDIQDDDYPIPYCVDKANTTIRFANNIILTTGSQISNTVGYDIVISLCFTGNTKVWTNYGVFTFSELRERFKKGEQFTTKTITPEGKIIDSKITNVGITGEKEEFIKIYFDENNFIECTPNHPFIISNPKQEDKHIIYKHGIATKEAQYLTEEDDIEEYKTNEL